MPFWNGKHTLDKKQTDVEKDAAKAIGKVMDINTSTGEVTVKMNLANIDQPNRNHTFINHETLKKVFGKGSSRAMSIEFARDQLPLSEENLHTLVQKISDPSELQGSFPGSLGIDNVGRHYIVDKDGVKECAPPSTNWKVASFMPVTGHVDDSIVQHDLVYRNTINPTRSAIESVEIVDENGVVVGVARGFDTVNNKMVIRMDSKKRILPRLITGKPVENIENKE